MHLRFDILQHLLSRTAEVAVQRQPQEWRGDIMSKEGDLSKDEQGKEIERMLLERREECERQNT